MRHPLRITALALILAASPLAAPASAATSTCADATLYPTRATVPAGQGTNINYDVTGCDRVRASSDPFEQKWDSIFFERHPVGHPLIFWRQPGVYVFVLRRHWDGSGAACGRFWCGLRTRVTVLEPPTTDTGGKR